ncbi:MAG: UxaA family hydrolase, partial [Oscillospiraceae bacterium]|nr:UxaA family hydrolase [Oscillospiraceae bacterium]
AETILMNRCRNRGLFEKTVKMINDFKGYYMRYGEKIDENPSPGNKAGGITTLEDKALGCTQKGGLGEVCGVLDYGEPVLVKGLNLLTAPGNDLVASTALAVSGAHIVLFTTGRGTPFGCPVPTVKISTNTALYDKKRAWIDFDAGVLVTNGFDMKATAEEFFSYILAVAGGEKTATEKQDIRDIAIFKDGVTL